MPTKASAAALLLSFFVHAGTLFNPWANATISVAAIGTGSDGGTTYVEVATARPSFLRYHKLLGPAGVHTFHCGRGNHSPVNTFVEDASGWRESEVVFGGSDAVTCSFGTAGRGTCVESVPFRTTTIIATYSGSVVPFYTLAASTPTKSPQSYTLPDGAEFYALDHGAPERSCAEPRLLVLWCCISPIGLALQFL
ncbi:hypothetical protein B0H14DRAFT_3896563 [Mycena olivaceomarginata]|nr:hypothetical protein B0H14DRAFT_3896563 [Mycena olivaceomarginata]